MNAIYSYKPVVDINGNYSHYKPLDPNFFKLAKKSVESVSKFYKTTFYTDNQTHELFKKNHVFFDEVVILDALENKKLMNYALPKIYAMLEQEQPFIMFDFDTIISEELTCDYDITYAYYEVDLTENFNPSNIKWIMEAYLTPFQNKISGYYDLNFVNSMDWRRYPNFSVLMVKDVFYIKQFYLDLFERVPLNVIETTSATLIEQFIFHQFVMLNGLTYGTFLKSYTDVKKIKKEKIYHLNINEVEIDSVINIIEGFI
jgi:hypothetical protein